MERIIGSDYPYLAWRKSSASAGNGQCFEVAELYGDVVVRDSKDPDGPVLRFTRQAWADLMTGVKANEFDM